MADFRPIFYKNTHFLHYTKNCTNLTLIGQVGANTFINNAFQIISAYALNYFSISFMFLK